MRSESSALSLHHIKTTELFSRFGSPLYQRACRAFGNRAVSTAVRFSVGCKKTTVSQSFWYSRVSASTPSVRESGRRNAVLRFQVGVKKTTELFSRFGTPVYQRACRAYGNRDDGTPSFDSKSGLKKRLNYSVVLVLPTGIEPITNP